MRLSAALGVLLTLVLSVGQASAHCSLDRFAELPVTMSNLRPLITAKINGADARFTIDSGAFYSTLDPAAAARFHLRLEPVTNLVLYGVGGSTGVSVTTVRVFTIAGVPVKNVQFLVPESLMGDETAGLLGQNVLDIGDVEYDFANGVMRLMRASGCGGKLLAYWLKPGESYGLVDLEPMSRGSSFAIGRVTVNGVRLRALFDTGASTSVLTMAAARRAGIAPEVMTDIGMTGGIGRRMIHTWITPVASFEIGGETIKNTRLRVSDMPGADTDMLIGADFFLSHHVYVANSQTKLYFTYNGGPVFRLDTPSPEAEPTSGAQAEDASTYARQGAALASRQQYAAAVDDFSRAITLAPNEADYRLRRGEALAALKKEPLAIADLNAALKLAPRDAAIRMARAELRLAAHSPDKTAARADLDAASNVLAKQADERLELGRLYYQTDAAGEAVGQYDLWLASHRQDARVAYARGERCWVGALLGADLKKAVADCNAALKARSNDPAILDSRGLARLRLGDYDQAIADYDLVLAAKPKTAWSLYGRGLAEIRKGATARGKADIAAALAIDPDIAKTAAGYGIAP
ncbi:MAG: aspartyl protease family protein [Caulobacteraceae bacterium]